MKFNLFPKLSIALLVAVLAAGCEAGGNPGDCGERDDRGSGDCG